MSARTLAILAAAAAFSLGGTGNLAAQDRTLTFKQMHTGEELTVTYMRNGRHDRDALRRINHIMRDWRSDETIEIDPRLIDLLWEVRRETGSQAPVQVFSAYRSPATNERLRSRSSGVAQNSQHTRGRALDFKLSDVPVSKLRETALKFQAGGVGFYASSGFVHIDTARVRSWPRLSRQQLENLFPDGKTLHLPSDGKPLAGYELAKAEAEAGTLSRLASTGGDQGGTQRNAGRGLLAGLFGGRSSGGARSEDPAQAPAPQERPAEVSPEPAQEETQVAAASAPVIVQQPGADPAETPAESAAEPALAEAPLPPERPVVAGAAQQVAALPPQRPVPRREDQSVPPSLTSEDIASLTALAPHNRGVDELPFAETFTDAGRSASPATPDNPLRPYVTASSSLDAPELASFRHPDQDDLGELMKRDREVSDNRFEQRPPSFEVAGFTSRPQRAEKPDEEEDSSWGIARLWAYLTRS